MEIVIDGRYRDNSKDARQLVVIDGQEYWIRQKEYRWLLKLLPPQRWVNECDLVDDYRERVAAVIYLLRQALPVAIHNNRHGAYMLDVDPGCVVTKECDQVPSR